MPANLLEEARALEPQLLAHRRTLHACAETGFELNETYDYVWKCLEELELSPRACGRRGISCTLGRPGRCILLRADMDALPLREESGLPFACKSGRMHACGHDMHTAMLLGAARLLKAHAQELQGSVKLMFQPAEETLEGARDMIDGGILKNPTVDGAMMLHVMTGQDLPAGTVIISPPGVSAPAAGMFSIQLQGKGAHGAMPAEGVDPLNAAAHILIALQAVNARELGMHQSAALTIGMLQAGVTANVIPDTALMRGSYRAFDDAAVELIRRRIAEISTGTAAVFRAKAELRFDSSCPALLNDPGMCAKAEACCRELLGDAQVFSAAKLADNARASGSEDFAAVSRRVPSVMLALAAGQPSAGHVHPLHHPAATFDEAALAPGCAVYAHFALRWLEEQA